MKYQKFMIIFIVLSSLVFFPQHGQNPELTNGFPFDTASSEPYATFAFSLTNDTVKVNSMSTGDDKPFILDWDFGDGTILQNANKEETHVYAANGTYTIRLNVTDNDGDTSFMEKNVTVSIIHYGDDVIVIHGYSSCYLIMGGFFAVMIVNLRFRRNKQQANLN